MLPEDEMMARKAALAKMSGREMPDLSEEEIPMDVPPEETPQLEQSPTQEAGSSATPEMQKIADLLLSLQRVKNAKPQGEEMPSEEPMPEEGMENPELGMEEQMDVNQAENPEISPEEIQKLLELFGAGGEGQDPGSMGGISGA